uniref:Capsid maturation protease n=1 Tax=Oryzias latipes TaxID=8090 RepID=A0A286P9U7_ORYLA|nr:capsid maturation protease [Oryzias latipes]
MPSGDCRGSPYVPRTGPLFCLKGQSVYVKMTEADEKRALLSESDMTLVGYADSGECEGEELRSDPSVFVPIFCRECYGTETRDYEEALRDILARGTNSFIVGVCSVYGAAPDEIYPESRAEFSVENALSFSGACHPQPGKAVFLHDAERDIGCVKCYWHVHSRSADKTFLFCCVACDGTEYTARLLSELRKNETLSTAFSLGTVGDNSVGPVVEECSLVSVPMRPACFCVALTDKDLVSRTMTRMGFCSVKDKALEAGLRPDEGGSPWEPEGTGHPGLREGESSEDGIEAVRRLAIKQADELRALEDVLKAIKVQNGVLAQRLKWPQDPDTLFTMRGAKDFTERTGVSNRLCAGEEARTNAATPDRGGRGSEKDMEAREDQSQQALSRYELEEVRRLLSASRRAGEEVGQRLPQYGVRGGDALAALGGSTRRAPHYSYCEDDDYDCNEVASGRPRTRSQSGKTKPSPVDRLTEQQRREVALEYNRQESEREEASRKKRETMIEMIKASMGDLIKSGIKDAMHQERGFQATAEEVGAPQSALPSAELETLARDTPYNRQPRNLDGRRPLPESLSVDVPALLKELEELRQRSFARSSGKSGDSEGSLPMDTDDDAPTGGGAEATSSLRSNGTDTTAAKNKQQAGYTLRPSGEVPGISDSHGTLQEFISAVSVHR